MNTINFSDISPTNGYSVVAATVSSVTLLVGIAVIVCYLTHSDTAIVKAAGKVRVSTINLEWLIKNYVISCYIYFCKWAMLSKLVFLIILIVMFCNTVVT